MGIETATFNASGKLVRKTAPLEQCLWQDGLADVNFMNNQGLLTKSCGSNYEQGKNVYFWHPIDGRVTRFDADSDRANLNCNRDPDNSKSFSKEKDEISSLGIAQVTRV